MSEIHQFKTTVGGREIIVETGRLAQLAGGSVTVREEDTMILATATMSRNTRDINFLPLSVDFEEKLYAAGRIPGNWFRREGRPPTKAILNARLIDRPLRPLFPKGMRNEIQVIITPFAHDQENQIDIMSIVGASMALTISDIPFEGPVGAVRVGMIDGEFVINPTVSQMADTTLDLRMAGTADAILMVECGAQIVDESVMVEALSLGHKAMQPYITIQNEMREAIGKEKREIAVIEVDEAFVSGVTARVEDEIVEIVKTNLNREDRNAAMETLRETVLEEYKPEEGSDEEVDLKLVKNTIGDVLKSKIREQILHEGVRPDGRDYTTIRQLTADVGVIPRAHGTGLFSRGETQVLSFMTLGTPRDAQKYDGIEPEEDKKYIHHYNFPPYSTGETWFLRGPKRREIGHGILAETALRPVIPEADDDFPYTIRVVSEALASNGSTSMASVCGSTLSLMDGGVPIKAPVAGIAMGLITDGEKFAILTDIQGMEDHLGDMDFKVAGTAEGITALQMDIKIKGLSPDVMTEALEQARVARLQILDVMTACIAEPRDAINPSAPQIIIIQINPEKIGAVIGKGGETIRRLQTEYGTKIDIEEDGKIFIAGEDGYSALECKAAIEALTESAEIGRIYTGKVTRVADFGAFVQILPGLDGLVHISQLDSERVEKVEDIASVGDELMVMVTNIDGGGKVRLSRQAVLEGWTIEEAQAKDKGGRSGGGNRGGRGGGRGGDRRGGGGNRGGRR